MRCFAATTVLLLSTWATAESAVKLELPDLTAGKVEHFDRTNLFDAINGAAELYLSYGFEQLQLQAFKGKDIEVTASLYDMGKSLNSLGIFRRVRPPKAVAIEAGTEAAAALPYQCLLFKDRFFVTFDAVKGKLDEARCTSLLQAAAKGLPGSDAMPTEVAPLARLVPPTAAIGYTRKGFLGLGDLNRCAHAEVPLPGGKATLFSMLPAGDQTVEQLWQRLAGNWKHHEHEGMSALFREVPYQGPVVLMRRKGAILGLIGASDRDQTLAALLEIVGSAKR